MASSYKHDAQGFLIGEVIDSNRELLRSQQQSAAVWKAIRTDVRSIARAVGAQVSNNVRAGVSPASTTRMQGVRTGGGNYVGGRQPAAQPVGRTSVVRGAGSVAPRHYTSVAVTQPRGANGRFVAGTAKPATPTGRAADGRWVAGQPRNGGAAPGKADSLGAPSAVKKLSDSIAKMTASLSGADNIDPALNTAKEVKDAVSPLGRGLFSLFGRNAERKKERWYGRFLKVLTAKKPGETTVVRAGGGGILGLGSIGGGLLGAGGGLLGGLLKGGSKLLRRIPLLGALLAGGSALSSIFGDDDPSLSPDENRKARYRGVGEAGGMLAGALSGASLGAAIGTAILPGVGTAIGGFLGGVGGALLGEQFGAKVGEWTKTLVDSDIGGKMVAAWSVTTTAIGAAWGSFAADASIAWAGVTTKANEWWESTKTSAATLSASVSAAAAGVNDWIKTKTGVDVKAAASNAWDGAKNAAGGALSAAKDGASTAGSAVLDAAKATGAALTPNTLKKAYSAGSAAATQARAGYDEARGNPTGAPPAAGPLQAGARAAGGMAGAGINKVLQTGAGYNVVQNADGSVTRQDGARSWRNFNPGNIEAGDFATKHGAIGSDGRFAIFPDYATGRAAQEALIFDGKNYKDKSLTDAISRYAPPSENNTAGYQAAVLGAVGGSNKKMSDYTPAERSAIMDAMQRVEGFKVGESTVISAGNVAAASTISASSMPTMPAVSMPSSVPSKIPTVPEVKELPNQLNSGAGAGRGAPQPIVIPERFGQDVADRRIAQIVSGGIA